MIFTSSFLTTAGIQLLTQATSGSSIVWTDCGCSSVYDQDTITASTTTFDSFVCKGTAVATFNNSGNIAAISCSMTNNNQDCTEGDADIFGLWAHVVDPLGNIGEDVLVLIAKRGSAAATHFPAYIDETTELTAIVDLSVEMNDGVVASINLIQSAFALSSNLQTEISAREALAVRVAANEDICSRVVTAHAAGSPTTGDNQTIYGQKTFVLDTEFSNGIKVSRISDVTNGYLMLSSNKPGEQSNRVEFLLATSNVQPQKMITFTANSFAPNNSDCVFASEAIPISNIYSSEFNAPITEEWTSRIEGVEVFKAGNTIFNGSGDLKLKFTYDYTGYNYDGTGKYQRPESSSIRLDNTLLDSQGSATADIQIMLYNQSYDRSSTLTIYSLYSSSTVVNLGQHNDNVELRVYGSIATLAPTDGSQNSELPLGALALVLVYSPGNNVPYTTAKAKTGALIYKHSLSISDLEMYYADIDNLGNFVQGNQISITTTMRFRLLSGLAGGAGGYALVMRTK